MYDVCALRGRINYKGTSYGSKTEEESLMGRSQVRQQRGSHDLKCLS